MKLKKQVRELQEGWQVQAGTTESGPGGMQEAHPARSTQRPGGPALATHLHAALG